MHREFDQKTDEFLNDDSSAVLRYAWLVVGCFVEWL